MLAVQPLVIPFHSFYSGMVYFHERRRGRGIAVAFCVTCRNRGAFRRVFESRRGFLSEVDIELQHRSFSIPNRDRLCQTAVGPIAVAANVEGEFF